MNDKALPTRRHFLAASAAGMTGSAWPRLARAALGAASSNEAGKEISVSTASNQISKWAGTLKPALAVPNEPKAVRGWCPRARAKFRELLAVDGKAALSAPQRPLSRERHGQIVLHRVAIELPNEDPWEAFIIEPADVKPPRPAWLCLHGHVPGGASSVTGLLVDSPGGKESLVRFEDDYALQLANRGYVTLAFDFPGFAARGDQSLPSTEMILRALILGRPYLGWCVWNAMAALTVLRSWPSVDPGRVGVTGFSMGGTLSGMLAAVDSRVCAAALSGRFPSWRDRLARGGMASGVACVPGLMSQLDLNDALATAVPKPLFISQEVRGDPEKSRRLLEPIRRAYEGFDAADKLTEYYDAAPRHRFVGKPLYEWVQKLWPIG